MVCNINLILRKDGKPVRKVAECMNAISYVSFRINPHGEGFYGVNGKNWVMQKGKNKLIYTGTYSLLCTHQRLATSGNSDLESNSHPHETKNLIVIHNGTFDDLGNRKKSDTRVFADILEKAFTKSKKDILKAINFAHKGVGGSYSIVVVVKETGKVYYYKNSLRDMFYVDGKATLIMSTLKDNVRYGKAFFSVKGKIKSVKDDRVYDVLDNLSLVGKIKRRQPQGLSKWQKMDNGDYIHTPSKSRKGARKKHGYHTDSFGYSDTLDERDLYEDKKGTAYFHDGCWYEVDGQGTLYIDGVNVGNEMEYFRQGKGR